ncbi:MULTISPECIES: ArsR/SmtB family transcription factor [unclassified Streptomyces]|uniref:ArsR/SmtB family transcription factor n=1 Tax=unclassified Streptomyces TaxID=2593676 RepID=UPI0007486FE4|nr:MULTISPECIES: metalloregulator ArsR/SmtB family transcription factor [unclassified Streptomyces]KUL63457.1 ArsR family transcriptional regulator [Streptomyces sp. NRRL S-1521]THC54903.1 metalloregulator ArsR/SmtB family transcription factor [Streptomyces sp. A1499]
MDEVFKALAHASRRRLLDRLNERSGQSLLELCAGLDMTRQAVSKHLAVLEGADLVTVVRRGRERLHYLNPVPIHEMSDRWIGPYERGRMAALGNLKQALEGTAMSKPEYVYTIYIHTTPDKLWEGLTSPEFLKQYHGGWAPSSDWQVGSKVLWPVEENGEPQDLGQVVTEAEPGKRLAYTWHTLQPMHQEMFGMSDAEFAEAAKERSKVSFAIEPAEEPEMGVKLTITHDGFASADSKMLEGVSGGWTMMMSELKTILEKA